jgi:hypothetical protein
MEPGMDRPGGDYHSFPLGWADPSLCQSACIDDASCRAWTYAEPNVVHPQAFCFLKSSVPAAQPNDRCTSGLVPSEGPIVRYAFDADVEADASGNGNRPLWTLGTSFISLDPDGVDGSALAVSPGHAYPVVPAGIVSQLEDFTISSFVKLDKVEAWSRIFDFTTGPSSYMYLTPMNHQGVVSFGINGGSGEQTVSGTQPLLGGVNGYNAQVVMWQHGAFVQLSDTTWVENRHAGSFSYQEIHRDAESVHLYDASRNVGIQLNLFSNEILFWDSHNPSYTFLTTITAANPDEINGYAASRIYHSTGAFLQRTSSTWVGDRGERSFIFTEVRRDEQSVHLRDSTGGVAIELNLRTKTIHYERQSVFGGSFDEENQFRFQDSENPFAAAGWYPMTRTGPEWRNNQWTHVAVTKQGNVAKLYVNGALVGANDNMTLRPADLGVSYGRIGTSPSRNAPELIGSIDDFRIYDRALGAKELQRTTGPDPELITFMGTQTSMTPDELKWDLEKIGYKLVSKDELGENECTILYANADRKEMSANAGVLMCNTKLANGDVELSSQAVYGGCDGARLDQGVGSTCEVGVAKSELKIKVADGLYNHIEAKGLSAEQCSALSTENTCFGASATVASASYSWKSKNGTGLGVGASIGVGGGAKTRVEDGVLKGEFDVKLGIGFQVQYSVSGKDVLEVYRLGETAWLENEGEIVAVGDKTVQAFESLGNEVHDVGGQAIGVLELGGKNVLVVTNDVGQSVEETYETVETAIGSAAEDVSNGIVDTAGKVANGASTATDETVTFVGEGVSYLGGLF